MSLPFFFLLDFLALLDFTYPCKDKEDKKGNVTC